MLAIVKEKPGPGFTVREVEIPTCAADEVLIKVVSVGICGSDMPIFSGIRQVPLPFIPGHEYSGVIVETGSRVSKYKKGDKVVPSVIRNCLTCSFCREGDEILCDHLLETGIHVNGAFAEFVTVPEHSLHPLPENLSFVEAAMTDPVASAYRPVKKAQITTEEVVTIFGPGPIGLLALQAAKAEGAKKVIVVGTRASRLNIALELGADEVVNIGEKGENAAQKIREFTNGRMSDVIIEATGQVSVLPMCIDSLRKKGRLVLAGIFHEETSVALASIVRRELTICGSICYTYQDFEHCLDLISSGKIKVKPLITHELPLKDAEKAQHLIKTREALKVVLHP